LVDVQQFVKQLLVNILLANGDAHLKNWNLLYPDKIAPRLSPAYDIVTTNVYITNETKYALNLGKTKQWYQVSMTHFQAWAAHSGIPWRSIRPHLNATLEQAKTLRPQAMQVLPMNDKHKTALRLHWQNLHRDFRIETFQYFDFTLSTRKSESL